MNRYRTVATLLQALTLLTAFPAGKWARAEQPSYQDAATKCDEQVQGALAKLAEDYQRELARLRNDLQLSGDLEKTLAVKREETRFGLKKTLAKEDLVESPNQLKELQRTFFADLQRVSEDIARATVIGLDGTKRKLTVEGKLDEATRVQAEIDVILKKYRVANPLKGNEISKEEMPKTVTMNSEHGIPTIINGQNVGYMRLRKGESFNLVRVDGNQVILHIGQSDVAVPVESTDLLQQIERTQKGDTGNAAKGGDVAEVLVGAWRHKKIGWMFVFSADGSVVSINLDRGAQYLGGRWSVEGDAVVIRSPNGYWEKFFLPIDPRETINLNKDGNRNAFSKLTVLP